MTAVKWSNLSQGSDECTLLIPQHNLNEFVVKVTVDKKLKFKFNQKNKSESVVFYL